MKKIVLVLLAAVVLTPSGLVLAQDAGVPDTLYVEIYPGDDFVVYPPHFARFPIFVTHDIVDPALDSIAVL
jgi:hypothetical protein